MEYPEEKEPPEVITSDTENATKVQAKDAPPGKKAKFRRLSAYNKNTWNGPKRENTEVIRRQDDLHRFDSVASDLLSNRYQREEGRRIFDGLNFHEFGGNIDQIIFGVCVIVANADVEGGTLYHPHPDAPNDREFVKAAETFDLSRGQQTSAIEKVRARTDL